MTNAERARALGAVLDAVRTNAEARRVAAAAAARGREAIERLGGFVAAGMRNAISLDVARVVTAADKVPDDAGAVDDVWNERPGGLRAAIESLTANVWAQESAFPAGTGLRDDFAIFADGFVDGLKGELDGLLSVVPALTGALAPVLWPIAIVVVVVGAAVLALRVKGGA